MTSRFRSLAVAAALLAPAVVSAQSAGRPFIVGSRIASVGLLAGGANDGLGLGGSVEVGVYDFAPAVTLGLGAFAGFTRREVEPSSNFQYSVTTLPIMAIGNVHFALPEIPRLDLYAGVGLGIERITRGYDDDEDDFPADFDRNYSRSDVALGMQVGARFAFTQNVTAMAQLGVADMPLVYAGLSFNF